MNLVKWTAQLREKEENTDLTSDCLLSVWKKNTGIVEQSGLRNVICAIDFLLIGSTIADHCRCRSPNICIL